MMKDIKPAIRHDYENGGYWMEPATGVCQCGAQMVLSDPLDNLCFCGRCYNMSGQEVTPSWECYGGLDGTGEPIDGE
jgi:hypothetical protein